MDQHDASRKIRALTAIVQTMMTELYGMLTEEQATATFAKRRTPEHGRDGPSSEGACTGGVARHKGARIVGLGD